MLKLEAGRESGDAVLTEPFAQTQETGFLSFQALAPRTQRNIQKRKKKRKSPSSLSLSSFRVRGMVLQVFFGLISRFPLVITLFARSLEEALICQAHCPGLKKSFHGRIELEQRPSIQSFSYSSQERVLHCHLPVSSPLSRLKLSPSSSHAGSHATNLAVQALCQNKNTCTARQMSSLYLTSHVLALTQLLQTTFSPVANKPDISFNCLPCGECSVLPLSSLHLSRVTAPPCGKRSNV